MYKMYTLKAVTILCFSITLTSCASKQHDTAGVPPTYQEAVKAGRLSPDDARSLRGTAPQVDRMNAFVDQVEKARTKINKMDISESEKRRLIRIEMRKAGKEWTDKIDAL
jgi:hypothetical protein